jgi:hypothetical protein
MPSQTQNSHTSSCRPMPARPPASPNPRLRAPVYGHPPGAERKSRAGSGPPARLVAGQDVWDLLDPALKLPFTEKSQIWTQASQDGSGLVFLQRECCRRSWLIVVFSSVQLIEGRRPMQARAIRQFWGLEGYLGKRIQLELGAGHRGMKCCIASSAYRTVNNYSGQPLATFLYL